MFRKIASGLILATAVGAANASVVLSEGFDDITTLAAKGWVIKNLSSPVGPSSYFQGNPAVFSAFSGAASSYIGANFLNGADGAGGNISDWLFTPQLTYGNSGTLSFALRLLGEGFLDTVQVYYSTSGASTDVGTTGTSTGVFTLLQTFSASSDTGWQGELISIPVLSGSGRLAFRYVASNTNTQADYIGIDSVSVSIPEPSTLALSGLALAALALSRRRKTRV